MDSADLSVGDPLPPLVLVDGEDRRVEPVASGRPLVLFVMRAFG